MTNGRPHVSDQPKKLIVGVVGLHEYPHGTLGRIKESTKLTLLVATVYP
jgi:hypothetical protein